MISEVVMTVVHVSKDNSKLPKQSSDPNGKASIRFSTIVDIGKATFSYDMRRLTEILAFPKAWYRRTLGKSIVYHVHFMKCRLHFIKCRLHFFVISFHYFAITF